MSLHEEHISALASGYGLILFVATLLYIQFQYRAAMRVPKEGRRRPDYGLPVFAGLVGLSCVVFTVLISHVR